VVNEVIRGTRDEVEENSSQVVNPTNGEYGGGWEVVVVEDETGFEGR
jgi:hypothetical protein